MDKNSTILRKDQFLEKHPAIEESWLTYQLMRRNKNGLAPAVRLAGKRFFIDEDLFFQWLDGHQDGGGS
jgi:hypothetical protein